MTSIPEKNTACLVNPGSAQGPVCARQRAAREQRSDHDHTIPVRCTGRGNVLAVLTARRYRVLPDPRRPQYAHGGQRPRRTGFSARGLPAT
jgi:hypothetical protein